MSNTITGTNGKDKLIGTNGEDEIFGLDGNDKLDGKDGNDFLDGGGGNDKIKGGKGDDTITGGTGEDWINAGKGDNLVYGMMSGELLIEALNGAIISDGLTTFDGNEIKVGNGMNTIYGTMEDMKLAAVNGFPTIGGVSGGSNDFVFNGNYIRAGNGDGNTIYGTMDELILVGVNSGAIGGKFGGSNSFTYGGNDIRVGNGDANQIYGTLNDVLLVAENQFSLIGGFQGGFNTIDMGGNYIRVGNGDNNQVYGSMHDMTIVAVNGGNIGGVEGGSNTFNLGGNEIRVGKGDGNQIYGTMHDLKIDAINGSTFGSVNYGGSNTFNFEGNDIRAGKGDNTVFGTMHDFTLTAAGGSVINLTDFNVAGNEIEVGNGDNTIYGTMHNFTLEANGVDGSGNGSLITANTFDFGSNWIEAGNGTNTIFGSMNDLTINAFDFDFASGPRFTTVGGVFNSGGNEITFGELVDGDLVGNSIEVGNGDGNKLYGTMHDMVMRAGFQAVVGGFEGGYNSLTFGANTLVVGNGDYNELYGSMHNIGNPGQEVVAFENGAIGGFVGVNGPSFNAITFGDNTLEAGNGDYNTLYGTLNDMNFVHASRFSTGGFVGGENTFTFGDNTLEVGHGDHNTLYGTLKDITVGSFANGGNDEGGIFGGFVGGGNTFALGENYLEVGNGDGNKLYGDMRDLNLMATAGGFIGSKYGGGNTFSYGSNVLEAGKGDDLQLYGTMHDITLLAQGTVFTETQIGARQSGNQIFEFGTEDNGELLGNHLSVGNGDRAELYGTLHDITLDAKGEFAYDPTTGEFTSARAHIGGRADNLGGNGVGPDGGNDFLFGNNSLWAGNGDQNKLYGSMRNLTLSAEVARIGGFNDFTNNLFFTDDATWGNTFDFGDNSLEVGNGDYGELYGTLDTLTLDVQGPYGGIGGNPHGFNQFLFGDNTLEAGDGVGNKLFGSMNELILRAVSDDAIDYSNGTNTPSTIGMFDNTIENLGPGISTFNLLAYGDNSLTVGDGGHSELYGTLNKIDLFSHNSFVGGYSNNGGNFYTFGQNELYAEGDDNHLYGTMRTLDVTAQNDYRVVNEIWFNAFTLEPGNNEFINPDNTWGYANNYFDSEGSALTVGDGDNNELYGTMEEMNLLIPFADIPGSVNQGGTGTIGHQAFGWTQFNEFSTAEDEFGDLLWGDFDNNNIPDPIPVQPTNIINSFEFGGNSLEAGDGHENELYGTSGQVLLSITNHGNEDDTLSDILLQKNDAMQSTIGAFGDVSGTNGNEFVFGGDKFTISGQDNNLGFAATDPLLDVGNTLTVGDGDENILYGSIEGLTLEVSGQYNVIGGLGGGFNHFTFGDNTLEVGHGDDNELYGTMGDLVLTAINGGSIGHVSGDNTGTVNENTFVFGDNELTVGDGEGNVLYGNLDDLIITQDNYMGTQPGAMSLIEDNTFEFGTNILNAGDNGSVLVGQLDDIEFGVDSAAGFTLADFNAQNTIISGHNTFNLGDGDDTVIFNVGIDTGENIINDWDMENDFLQFNDAMDLATLLSRTTVSDDGDGGTLVEFDAADGDNNNADGGSIQFVDVAYEAGDDITDLVSAGDHLIVVA